MTKIKITYVPEGTARKAGWQAYHPAWGCAVAKGDGSLDELMDAICYGTLTTITPTADYDDYPEWYHSYRFGD
jgi:hypothetical protein